MRQTSSYFLVFSMVLIAVFSPVRTQADEDLLTFIENAEVASADLGILPPINSFVHKLRLYYAGDNGDGELKLLIGKVPDSLDNGISFETLPHDLPEDFQLEALGYNRFLERVVAAGQLNQLPVIYVARLSDVPAELTFKPGPELPETDFSGFYGIYALGEQTFLGMYEEDSPEVFAGGYFGNLLSDEESFQWLDIPAPPRLTNTAVFTGSDGVFITGGTDPVNGSPTRKAYHCPFDGLNMSAWSERQVPTPPFIDKALGTQYGAGFYLAKASQENPTTPKDQTTSMTLYSSVERFEGEYSLWIENRIKYPATEIISLSIDPGHSKLLILTKPADLTENGQYQIVSADVPKYINVRPKSEDQVLFEKYQKMLPKPRQVSLEEVKEDAKAMNQLALVVVAEDEKMEDFNVRLNMQSNQYRYMTMNIQSTYLKGNAGKEVLSQYGITSTPAYLLMDADGQLVRSHVGTVPEPSELFELTSPSRGPENEQSSTE